MDDLMSITVDTREQLPYTFEGMGGITPYEVQRGTLVTGDVALWWPEGIEASNQIVIERKTLADLYSTLGQHRTRFKAEWERMAEYGYAAVVIEADWVWIMNPNHHLKHPTKMNPKSVANTLAKWSQTFGVHVWTVPGRPFAEKFTFRLLEHWWREHK